MIRVAIVDDHPLVRAGLAALLIEQGGVEIVGEGSDGDEAVALVEAVRPDVLLLDVSMHRVDGVAATRRVRVVAPELPVLIVTSSSDSAQLRAALAAGADGYLLKDADPDEIAAAVRAVARGRSPIDPRLTRALFADEPAPAAPPAATTPDPAASPTAPEPAGDAAGAASVPRVRGREADVLRRVARGRANKQIAAELGIAERTVKVHLGSVFRRIGVADRTSAALWARENGY